LFFIHSQLQVENHRDAVYGSLGFTVEGSGFGGVSMRIRASRAQLPQIREFTTGIPKEPYILILIVREKGWVKE
jgi:hypothetical protein